MRGVWGVGVVVGLIVGVGWSGRCREIYLMDANGLFYARYGIKR